MHDGSRHRRMLEMLPYTPNFLNPNPRFHTPGYVYKSGDLLQNHMYEHMNSDDLEAAYLNAAKLNAPDLFLSDLKQMMQKRWITEGEEGYKKFTDAYLDKLTWREGR